MAYQLQKDPREPNYARRLPTLRELQKPSELVKEDPALSRLGSRSRSMTLLLAVVGLVTFVVPLIGTNPTVMGQARWSPWDVVTGMLTGNLPAAVLLSAQGLHDLRWLAFVNTMLFGGIFVYIALATVLVVALGKAQRLVIGAAAGMGLVAALIEMRGFTDIQLAILGGPPATVGGQQVQGMTLCVLMFAIMVLLLAIASWKELDDL
ncbi:MAG TPA: hypothetical protein VK819_15110 [Acidobacteriaceae bacterium]|jgi:hypothetical protein|nr:hypothetical protein [Acidobacteriaceae bacterium]